MSEPRPSAEGKKARDGRLGKRSAPRVLAAASETEMARSLAASRWSRRRPSRPDPIVARITANTPAGRAVRAAIMQLCAEGGSPLSVQAVFAWRKIKGGVPVRRVRAVGQVLGLRPWQIRQDIFQED